MTQYAYYTELVEKERESESGKLCLLNRFPCVSFRHKYTIICTGPYIVCVGQRSLIAETVDHVLRVHCVNELRRTKNAYFVAQGVSLIRT